MVWVVNATPRPLYLRERPGTHCTGGWVGPKAGLEGYRKSRPPPGSDLRTVQLHGPLPPVSVDISKQSICASTAPLNLNGTHTTGLIVTVTSARQSPTLNNAGAAISNQLWLVTGQQLHPTPRTKKLKYQQTGFITIRKAGATDTEKQRVNKQTNKYIHNTYSEMAT